MIKNTISLSWKRTSILSTALLTLLVARNAASENNGIDPRIRPNHLIEVTSSNKDLDESISESIRYIYDSLVVGPRQYPTTEIDNRITRFREYGTPAISSFWGSYHGAPSPTAQGYRENFCLRDIAHQVEGGSILSLNEENHKMLSQFALDALKDTRIDINAVDPADPEATARNKSYWTKYWTLWSYNFYGFPYYMDSGFQELPAPYELLEKIYTMYEYTGDPRWVSDVFVNYGRTLHNEFSDIYDFNGNGIADNRSHEGILPTLWEFEGDSHLTKDDMVYNMNTAPYTLTIKKEYFNKLGVQDVSLKIRFRNGKDNFVHVKINNLLRADGTAPLLDHDYLRINTRDPIANQTIKLNLPAGVTLQSITDGKLPLIDEKDYTVSNNEVTLKANYFKDIKNNKSNRIKSSFEFKFSNGTENRLVIDMTDVRYPSYFDQHEFTLDWNNLQDVVIRVDLSGTGGNHELYRIENSMRRVAEAGDTLGVQYQSLLAMEGILRARANLDPNQASALNAEADTYKTRAATTLNLFRSQWYNDNLKTYARAFDGHGNAIYGWGHENSYFMPLKELLEPGKKADDYLQFIHEKVLTRGLNEEAITYLPEVFYNYGKNEEAWHWMQRNLSRFYSNQSEEQKQRTYPEIAFTNVSNIISYMMGYKPKVYKNTIETLSRLPLELDYVQVNNLPVGQSIMDVTDYNRTIDNLVNLRHQGTHTSTLTNQQNSTQTLTWKAQFEGSHKTLYINGAARTASAASINGVPISYVEVKVPAGKSKTITTIAP
ncbi:X2-like carbohydrate binding domain-containing protein [Microbulbifer sp. 2205BS26-8]|uniref:X2-like carbohydrate binding domain-containing protein n=1 Tax=Microbulbifer sp. 2205BS26-8 TaxID=3064386 RepID=UPI00273F33BE|nr:X2-like carbohydrate binding domain-containing protein [Microbulbifer sp. 2205BS26-8]MDP5210919.1 X2-like carbohydrate binding domain-containing protein [Microbulbifer sp. 2205BS26-8]